MDTAQGREIQNTVIQAIEQYTDRHNPQHAHEKGMNDLLTLQQIRPSTLIQKFNSSLQNGLSSEQVKINGQKYGVNQYRKRRKISLFEIFKEALCDEMLVILMISAVVSIIVEYIAGEDREMFWVDGLSILIAVIVCTSVATFSNYEKEKQFTQLDEMTENTFNYDVVRDGKRVEIHRRQIVPGDIIVISNGMEIPADCLIYKAINILVNESAVTGESVELEKNTFEACMERNMDPHGPSPYMISGSNVISGQGLMMATVVGKESQAGKNYQLIFDQDDQENDQTPLEQKLEEVGAKIGYFGLISAGIIFLVLILRLIIEEVSRGGFNFKENINQIVGYLIIAVSIVVVAVPEGLPLAVTLTLAYSMKAMHEDKILVRKLASCETMGAAKFICSDKTGTITQNKMNVIHAVNLFGIPIMEFNSSQLDKGYCDKLVTGIFHNSTAILQTEKGPQTEIALLKMASKLSGKNENNVRNSIGVDGYFYRLPFDSIRKRMTTGLNYNGRDLMFMNGASEQILSTCNAIQNCKNGQVGNLTPQIKDFITKEISVMASRGLRTISVAYKPINDKRTLQHQSHYIKPADGIEQVQKSGFILLGVFGIEDPPRPESKQAIQDCKDAGIHVIMVTGDNKVTAESISKQVGIIQGDGKGKIMEANDFIKRLDSLNLLKEGKVSEEEEDIMRKSGWAEESFKKLKKVNFSNDEEKKLFAQEIDNLVVLARSKPEHKYILVDGINKLGNVVAVTGDGANDAPALMRGDIGLAMGVTGTQVAKNASDIVLLDDNFSSIVRSVVWGRNVYLSIRKFLQFQLTVNLVAVTMCLISAAVIRQSVFPAVQMLWVNLIMDSLAALALATEPPNASELLKQNPNSPEESFLTSTIIKHIVGQAIFQVTILLILLFVGQNFIPESKDQFDSIIGTDLAAKYNNGIVDGTVADGRFYTISGEDNYHKWFKKFKVYSRHITFVYNAFVFLQVFNFVCCRRIKDELWLLKGLYKSKIFIFIIFVIVILQILLVTFGDKFFQVYKYHGLNMIQWVLSIGIGSLTIPVSLFLRVLPWCKPEEFVAEDNEDQDKQFVPIGQNRYSVVRDQF